jgi:hypothetical protein
MVARVQVVFDCADPRAMAGFWTTALGYELQPPPDGFDSWDAWLIAKDVPEKDWNAASAIVDPSGAGPRIFFQRVPEPKIVKNRLHLDIVVGDRGSDPEEHRRKVEAEVERLTSAGATYVREVEELGQRWITLRDPEGNEFDVA